jgi:hypothetical protein
MAQDTGVVIKHLGEDVTPQPAQRLAVPEHGGSAAGGLVDRLERLYPHTSNGIDHMRRGASGKAVPARGCYWLPQDRMPGNNTGTDLTPTASI